jgi:hypothetical protein
MGAESRSEIVGGDSVLRAALRYCHCITPVITGILGVTVDGELSRSLVYEYLFVVSSLDITSADSLRQIHIVYPPHR